MPLAKRKPQTIDEYLATAKPDQRRTLAKLRKTIHAVAPKVEECISYGIPAFRLNGRSLVFFGAWANHCSFYPGQFHDTQEISGRSERISDYQGHRSLLAR